jgi:hypothetical protein
MLLFWKRPSFWTGLIAILAYWDSRALNGGWVYDDAGSVLKNIVVTGMVDWKQAFTRDYWGVEMSTAASHKSFRPITTLTLKANHMWGSRSKALGEKHPPTYSFHLVNILLHGVVTSLITEAAVFVFETDTVLQLICGFIFGLHPVHAEVVSNITSRGELLMSMFSLIAFISFAYHLRHSQEMSRPRYIAGVYIVPWLGFTLSLFSKEQGATTLITAVLYDFLHHHGSVAALFQKLKDKNMVNNRQAWGFVRRTCILALQTLVIVYWRYLLNGETSPDFIEAQNPAGFASDRFTRAFSVSWIYCLYIRDALYPKYLCPDWSGLSIDLIDSLTDPRAIAVIALWYFAAQSAWTMIVGPPKGMGILSDDGTLRKINMAVWAFSFSPFLLSSNILVVVGLMKADRVIYLPLFGFCILEAVVLSKLLEGATKMFPSFETRRQTKFWVAHWSLMLQLLLFCSKTHQRNLAWSDALTLWEQSYLVNPRSRHTMYNYGYELSIRQRYEESEIVMRPIGDARVEGPSNTFIYTMVLFNLRRCDLANPLLDGAFEVIAEQRREGGIRNSNSALSRTESNLLVAKAHCATDARQRGNILFEAVQADQSNDYAVNLAQEFMAKMQQAEAMGMEL